MPDLNEQFKEIEDKLAESKSILNNLLTDPSTSFLFAPPEPEIEIEDEQ